MLLRLLARLVRNRPGKSLEGDAVGGAAWIAEALKGSGYRADFSVPSLKEVDRFFDEQAKDGAAVPGGLLSEQLGQRLFCLGAYVGEVIRRAEGGSWQAAGDDPQAEINLTLKLADGSHLWPVQRVMKRFRHGASEGVHAYALAVAMAARGAP